LIEKTPENSSPEPAVSSELERREYFRVDDQIILRYRVVAPEAINNTLAERHFDNADVFALLRELRQIDQENHNVLRSIAETNRELGIYLKSLNRKIDLITGALAVMDEAQQLQSPQPVSISETSLSFYAETELTVGTFVALELILLPQHTGLAIYGEVTAKRDNLERHVVVSFLRLRDSDRQLLARHVLQVQIAARKQQSQST
jgi:hypothetical protein